MRWREQFEAVVSIFNDVSSIASLENIGVRSSTTGQIVISSPAVHGVVVEKAKDGIVAIALSIFKHLPRDVGEIQRCAVIKDEAFDQAWGDIIQAYVVPERFCKQAKPKSDSA